MDNSLPDTEDSFPRIPDFRLPSYPWCHNNHNFEIYPSFTHQDFTILTNVSENQLLKNVTTNLPRWTHRRVWIPSSITHGCPHSIMDRCSWNWQNINKDFFKCHITLKKKKDRYWILSNSRARKRTSRVSHWCHIRMKWSPGRMHRCFASHTIPRCISA